MYCKCWLLWQWTFSEPLFRYLFRWKIRARKKLKGSLSFQITNSTYVDPQHRVTDTFEEEANVRLTGIPNMDDLREGGGRWVWGCGGVGLAWEINCSLLLYEAQLVVSSPNAEWQPDLIDVVTVALAVGSGITQPQWEETGRFLLVSPTPPSWSHQTVGFDHSSGDTERKQWNYSFPY